MSSIELYYLPLRARAEPIRMILQYGNVPYTDVIVSFEDWPTIKQSRELCPFGQLPTMNINNKVIAQSGALIRYAAKLSNVVPDDIIQIAEADMIVELAQEMNLINPILNWFEYGSESWQQAYNSYFSSFQEKVDAAVKILGEYDYFGRSSPHYGDFTLFHIFDNTLTVKPDALENHPKFLAWVQRMRSLDKISNYLSSRPNQNTPNWGKNGSLMLQLDKR